MSDGEAFVGRGPHCRKIVAAWVADTTHIEQMARDLLEWADQGLMLERVASQAVREGFDACACPQVKYCGDCPLQHGGRQEELL